MTNNINHFRELVDQAWEKHSHDHFCSPTAHDMEMLIKTCLMPLSLKTQNDSFTFVYELKQEMHADLKPQLRSTQIKDKVVPNKSQVKDKKTKVENHPRISSISNKTKSVTACNDSLKSRTSNVNAVCATCGKCLVVSDHFACVTKLLNDMNARTKRPNVMPISIRKPKGHVNKSIATPPRRTVASKSTIQNSKIYYRMLYEKTSTSSVNKSSSPLDNSKQQDTPPTMNIQSLTEPTTPTTTVNAKENNNDNQAKIQVDNSHVDDKKFYSVFSTPVREEADSSSRYVKESSRKGQNQIKTGQKREAWRSREKVKAVAVDRA
nr:hypothetical protein [Tanacetum cinerariifolium]